MYLHEVEHREAESGDICRMKWGKLVAQRLGCFYIQGYFRGAYMNRSTSFDYVPDKLGLPRILLLGDSLSRGTWEVTQQMFAKSNVATIHAAPENCGGFPYYEQALPLWLGTCSWDVIQFNVGMHFHGSLKNYRGELVHVTKRIMLHSPNAHIVFALTTPSPFDSADTYPDRATCKNYNKFHKQGWIGKLNAAAREALEPLGVVINDRYAAIHPVLGKHQRACDVHFGGDGYKLLATNDWHIISGLLPLP
eukprot:CAMPEP_0183345282 /NCGR_PEP_ID=MMETSP0164_2-20130417/10761_1 /TAXON_ID=221442 /ORGANISM="Coccolithus pelagicus ssp braarudi, Strain PLY182g" /LENGTH=249 /DNA_ID=CAMNT_0025516413 /DNA_START=9 /DNA_END=755 /DNA_ORIENTATION=+